MKIINILNAEQLKHIRPLVDKIEFESGDKTARGLAMEAKNNRQAIRNGESYKELLSYIKNILAKNDWLKRRFLPKKFSTPLINRYKAGESYGRHYDDSHMTGESSSFRNDYSFTLMLSSLEEYNGGELEIEHNGMKHNVKLDAGDMVIYPSTLIHNVLPVITGERLAYVGWIASHVKDPLALELLNAFEDMHLSLQKYELSSDDQLSLSYVHNKLQHLLSD
tara:strand:- start:576 stop:1241 length:666 start_codon:yes stop_codon:yes gene_type:complete